MPIAMLAFVMLLLACDQKASDTAATNDKSPTPVTTSRAPQEPATSGKPRAWPTGPFAHNCSPDKAVAEGDFDGDGKIDRVDFSPAYPNDAGFVGWTLRQHYGDGRDISTNVDTECPEAIGGTDIDQDGSDELLFDTGKGMTAAIVDLLVYDKGRLRQVTYRPRDTTIYVGRSNGGASDMRCYPTAGESVLEVLEVDRAAKRTTASAFVLQGRELEKTGTYHVRGNAVGRIRCFGLRWNGY
jgi:hypothetical protein